MKIREGQKINVVAHQHLGDEHLVMDVIAVTELGHIHANWGGLVIKFGPDGKSKKLLRAGQLDNWEIISVVERDPDVPLNALDFTFRTAGWSNWFGYGIRATYVPTGVTRAVRNIGGLNQMAGAKQSCSFGKVNAFLKTDEGRQYVFERMQTEALRYNASENMLQWYGFVREPEELVKSIYLMPEGLLGRCPKCALTITEKQHPRYCGCGQPISWGRGEQKEADE